MSQKKKVLLELKKLKKYFPVRRGVQIKALEVCPFPFMRGRNSVWWASPAAASLPWAV